MMRWPSRFRYLVRWATIVSVLAVLSMHASKGWAADERPAARGQEDPDYGKHGGYLLEPGYYGNFILNPLRFLASPLRWEAEHWASAALIAAGIGVIMLVDEPIRDFWQEDVRSDTTDDIADVGDTIGEFYHLLPAAGIGFVAGAALGSKRAQATALETVQALAITAGFTKALKYGTGRHRPNDSPDDAFDFDGPSTSGEHKSFVSGHASYSFTVASVIASNYEDNPYVSGLAYGLAGLSAWSRINDDKHWLSDVVVGAALGIVIGKLVHHTSPFKPDAKPQVSVLPFHDSGGSGVRLSLKF